MFPPLLLITDPAYETEEMLKTLSRLAKVLPKGTFGVRFRDRLIASQEKRKQDSLHLSGFCDENEIPFFENQFYSCHTGDDVEKALQKSYVGIFVSPIFATPGKGVPRGLEALREAKEKARGRLFIYALGGVNECNVHECKRHGANGVACIRAVWEAKNPEKIAKNMSAPFL